MSSHPLHRSSECEPVSAVFQRPALREGSSADPRGLPGSRLGAATWRAAYDRGRELWAEIRLSFEEFDAHARALGPREVPAYAADLYLTTACRLERQSAVRVLERDYVQRSRAVIQSMVRDAAAVEDILQDVRTRLIVGPRSKVACYRGTGPLGSWIRSIALNVARDHLRMEAARRRAEAAQALASARRWNETPPWDDRPTRCVLRQGRSQACLDAIRLAFHSLQPHERRLLHDHYVGGLSIDALAPLCLVNRATVARRIRRATDEVTRQARKQLGVLYPREDARSLDALALGVCRELIADPEALLGLDAPVPAL